MSPDLLVELSGVVAKKIRIVPFAYNPARSYKDIICRCTFYHVGNFLTFLQLLYLTVVNFGKAILFQQQDKAVPPVAMATVLSTCRYFKLG